MLPMREAHRSALWLPILRTPPAVLRLQVRALLVPVRGWRAERPQPARMRQVRKEDSQSMTAKRKRPKVPSSDLLWRYNVPVTPDPMSLSWMMTKLDAAAALKLAEAVRRGEV